MKLVKEFIRTGEVSGKALYAIRIQGSSNYLCENGSFCNESILSGSVMEFNENNISDELKYWQASVKNAA